MCAYVKGNTEFIQYIIRLDFEISYQGSEIDANDHSNQDFNFHPIAPLITLQANRRHGLPFHETEYFLVKYYDIRSQNYLTSGRYPIIRFSRHSQYVW